MVFQCVGNYKNSDTVLFIKHYNFFCCQITGKNPIKSLFFNSGEKGIEYIKATSKFFKQPKIIYFIDFVGVILTNLDNGQGPVCLCFLVFHLK